MMKYKTRIERIKEDLMERIEKNRADAEAYKKAGDNEKAFAAKEQASEVELALLYLEGGPGMDDNAKIKLCKEHLMKRIDKNRADTEAYKRAGNNEMAFVAREQAFEALYVLIHLQGFWREE